jgi:magnesium chelatase family protein
MDGVRTNAEVRSRDLSDVCRLSSCDKEKLVRLIERLGMSARAYDKVLRVARTIADLAGSESVRNEDMLSAISYRKMDERDASFWL